VILEKIIINFIVPILTGLIVVVLTNKFIGKNKTKNRIIAVVVILEVLSITALILTNYSGKRETVDSEPTGQDTETVDPDPTEQDAEIVVPKPTNKDTESQPPDIPIPVPLQPETVTVTKNSRQGFFNGRVNIDVGDIFRGSNNDKSAIVYLLNGDIFIDTEHRSLARAGAGFLFETKDFYVQLIGVRTNKAEFRITPRR
jgi:hypothetical protein